VTDPGPNKQFLLTGSQRIYVHTGDAVIDEGTELLTAEILGNGDPIVNQESEMVARW